MIPLESPSGNGLTAAGPGFESQPRDRIVTWAIWLRFTADGAEAVRLALSA